MLFYKNMFLEEHIVFENEKLDDFPPIFRKVATKYRFASTFPDYAAIKIEVRQYRDEEDLIEYDPVYTKEFHDIPGIGSDPKDYGIIIRSIFACHKIKYIIMLRRLSFYWWQVEIFEDKRDKIYNIIYNSSASVHKTLTEVMAKYKPIKIWKFSKFR